MSLLLKNRQWFLLSHSMSHILEKCRGLHMWSGQPCVLWCTVLLCPFLLPFPSFFPTITHWIFVPGVFLLLLEFVKHSLTACFSHLYCLFARNAVPFDVNLTYSLTLLPKSSVSNLFPTLFFFFIWTWLKGNICMCVCVCIVILYFLSPWCCLPRL